MSGTDVKNSSLDKQDDLQKKIISKASKGICLLFKSHQSGPGLVGSLQRGHAISQLLAAQKDLEKLKKINPKMAEKLRKAIISAIAKEEQESHNKASQSLEDKRKILANILNFSAITGEQERSDKYNELDNDPDMVSYLLVLDRLEEEEKQRVIFPILPVYEHTNHIEFIYTLRSIDELLHDANEEDKKEFQENLVKNSDNIATSFLNIAKDEKAWENFLKNMQEIVLVEIFNKEAGILNKLEEKITQEQQKHQEQSGQDNFAEPLGHHSLLHDFIKQMSNLRPEPSESEDDLSGDKKPFGQYALSRIDSTYGGQQISGTDDASAALITKKYNTQQGYYGILEQEPKEPTPTPDSSPSPSSPRPE